jgi:uncharacterized repeat protein (TIGR03803 family)
MSCTRSAILSLLFVLGFFGTSMPAHAADEKVLFSFNENNGMPFAPQAGVILDSAGNLYGYTVGGAFGGTVYELSPAANGRWIPKPIYRFQTNDNGGDSLSSLTFDAAGNLYGTTIFGGELDCGVVFQLWRGSNGLWREKILHSFAGGTDGNYPVGKLSIDAAGNVYGTTAFGGGPNRGCERGCGTVFKLTPGTNGEWTETIVHRFQYTREDGGYPNGGVVIDAAGNLYGTTELGGSHSGGTAFEMSFVDGAWTENIVYNFCSSANCRDGNLPSAGLIFDAAGNLYGTTESGGASAGCGGEPCGTVFELSPSAGNSWTHSVLYSFCPDGNCANGALPGQYQLAFDTLGNLYGTTSAGGFLGANCSVDGCGTVFELTPSASGIWSESVLYKFPPNGLHGLEGLSGVALDSNGNLYGTTDGGGENSVGTVFEVTP